MMRGFFEIGVYWPKTKDNIGTLFRSAYQLGAAGVFTIGHEAFNQRVSTLAADTYCSYRHIPLRHYVDFSHFYSHIPYATHIVAVETGGNKALSGYNHPQRAIYLLGAEDDGLTDAILRQCNDVVTIEAERMTSYNVAVAGSLVMYDRCYGRKEPA